MKVVWEQIPVDAISIISVIACQVKYFHIKIFLELAYKSAEMPGLKFIVFMTDGHVPTKSLNAFKKLVLEMCFGRFTNNDEVRGRMTHCRCP
jgi:hypothetical protein